MDATRTLLGSPPVRGDALACALGATVAAAMLVAVVDNPVAGPLLGAGVLLLVTFAAGAAYRKGGLPAALALAVCPTLGWYLGPLPMGGRIDSATVLVGVGIAVALGVVGFAIGAGGRAVID